MSEAQLDPLGPPRAGERLRAARERAGLSLTQVADQLRLSASVVEALEQGQYGLIGAQVFVRGYLKRYAELVGEDPTLANTAAQQHAWGNPVADLATTRLRPLDGTGDRVHLGRWPLVVAAVLLGLWGIYWWAQRAAAPRAAAATSDVVQEQVVTPPALGGAPVQPADAGGGAAAGGAASVAPGVTAAPAASPQASVARGSVALPGRVPAAGPAASSTAPPAAPASRSAPAPTPAPAAAPAAAKPAAVAGDLRRHVRLNFHGESWTELYDADGARLYWGLGEPGDLQAVSGKAPFKLILGNPDAVTVSLEGAALALPAPRGGTTLRIGIDARGALEPLR
jgi:cytoskeleton protein RodZ